MRQNPQHFQFNLRASPHEFKSIIGTEPGIASSYIENYLGSFFSPTKLDKIFQHSNRRELEGIDAHPASERPLSNLYVSGVLGY